MKEDDQGEEYICDDFDEANQKEQDEKDKEGEVERKKHEVPSDDARDQTP
jgi:hypothetical protein